MTDTRDNNASLVIDGAYLYLSSLSKAERIPRYRRNGLPVRTAPLPADLRDRFNQLGAPETVRTAGK